MTGHILLVEDDDDQAWWAKSVLEEATGVSVRVAGSVGQAIRELNGVESGDAAPVLVVLDMVLRRGDDTDDEFKGHRTFGGLTVLESMVAKHLSDIPVVIYSAFRLDDMEREIRGKGLERVQCVSKHGGGLEVVVRGLLAEAGHPLPAWPPPEKPIKRIEGWINRVGSVFSSLSTIGVAVVAVLGTLGVVFGWQWIQTDEPSTVAFSVDRATWSYTVPDLRGPRLTLLPGGSTVDVVCVEVVGDSVWASGEQGWVQAAYLTQGPGEQESVSAC